MSTSPFGLKAGCRQEAQLGVAKCSAGSLSEMSSRARHTPRNSLGELVPFMEVVGIYGEVARVSRARFVWLGTIARTGVLEEASSVYSEAGEGTLLGVKAGR